MNIPSVTAFSTVDGKRSLDEDAILDAFEKLREFIAYESKKNKDDLIKVNLQVDGKVREKIDKKDLEEIESKIFHVK